MVESFEMMAEKVTFRARRLALTPEQTLSLLMIEFGRIMDKWREDLDRELRQRAYRPTELPKD